MNLRESLLQSKKPTHQFHDEYSLKWIADNKPDYLKKKYTLTDFFAQIIKKNLPWEQCHDFWFSNNSIRDGIHGFRHASRVAIYSVLIALQNRQDISEAEIKAVMFAGLLHDCRRKNDNADLLHGVRADKWLHKNINVLPDQLKSLSKAMRFAISVHNNSYDEIINSSGYKNYKFFVDILKTADALDRYRFPREDWWIDSKFIVLQPNNSDMAFAYDLTLESEKLYLDTKNNQFSIMKSWERMVDLKG